MKRKDKRHSNFWVGMYGYLWMLAGNYLFKIMENMMNLNPQKKPNYRKGLRAMSQLEIL